MKFNIFIFITYLTAFNMCFYCCFMFIVVLIYIFPPHVNGVIHNLRYLIITFNNNVDI